MKKQILILTALLCVIGFTVACNDNTPIVPKNIYYIIGYHIQSGVDTANGIGKAGQYLFVSENLKDTLAANNLPDNLFIFPAAILYPSTNFCGFVEFPQEYKFKYKVQMTYRYMTEEEREEAFYTCNAMIPWSSIVVSKYIFINSILKEY